MAAAALVPRARLLRRPTAWLVVVVGSFACPAPKHADTEPPRATAPTKAKAKAKASAPGPARLDGMADAGTFFLLVDGTPMATIEHAWKADGSYRAKTTLTYAGQSVEQSIRIGVDEAGAWTTIEAEAPTGKAMIVRDGLTVTTTHRQGAESTKIEAGTVLFETFSPALLRHVLRRYDAAKGGTQSFPALVPGGSPIEATLTRRDDESRSLGGRDTTFGRWTLELAGVAMELWTEPDGRVVFAGVPMQRAAFVREGYEPLAAAQDVDPLLSKAEHEVVVDDEVVTTMRDGIELRADVYRPTAAGRHPTIVVRTPYKKELAELQGRYFARRGYAYVVQDVRGRFASKGEWKPFVNEKHDGHDTVEWAAAQPWSSGKVGMIGASYLGWVQWLAAVERPPHLVTIIPNVSPPDAFYNIPYEHGVFFLWGAIWWADVATSEATADLSGVTMQTIGDKRYGELLRALPVIELDKAVLGGENPHWREWIAHPTNDEYWAGASFLEDLRRVDLPVFHQSGWFDGDGIGSKLSFGRMAKLRRKHQKLVLGPWGHTDTASRRLGNRDFGPEAVAIDLQREYLRWFDRWLKGVDNGIDREPAVRIFAMGSNRWLAGDTYPLPGTSFEKWHLRSEGHANGLRGDGVLTRELGGSGTDSYVYDPGDPTPDPAYYEPPLPKPGEVVDATAAKAERQAHRDRVLGERKDILVYTSEPFAEDTTFAGPISAVLHAATTARDTDWFMTLVELDAEGKPFPLVQGRLRARFRESTKKPTLLRPGKLERYELDLWQTGITVRKGHRLRVELASASFPMWSRNLNTGGHNETETEYVSATQTIHHSKRYPSYVLLPRVANPQ